MSKKYLLAVLALVPVAAMAGTGIPKIDKALTSAEEKACDNKIRLGEAIFANKYGDETRIARTDLLRMLKKQQAILQTFAGDFVANEEAIAALDRYEAARGDTDMRRRDRRDEMTNAMGEIFAEAEDALDDGNAALKRNDLHCGYRKQTGFQKALPFELRSHHLLGDVYCTPEGDDGSTKKDQTYNLTLVSAGGNLSGAGGDLRAMICAKDDSTAKHRAKSVCTSISLTEIASGAEPAEGKGDDEDLLDSFMSEGDELVDEDELEALDGEEFLAGDEEIGIEDIEGAEEGVEGQSLTFRLHTRSLIDKNAEFSSAGPDDLAEAGRILGAQLGLPSEGDYVGASLSAKCRSYYEERGEDGDGFEHDADRSGDELESILDGIERRNPDSEDRDSDDEWSDEDVR